MAALTVLALLSKESGLLIPGFLLALAPARRFCLNIPLAIDPSTQPRRERAGMLWLILLVCWTVSGLIVLREEILHLKFEWDRSFLDFTIQPLVRSPAPDRWLIPIALIGRYLGLLVAPIHLSIDYGIDLIRSTIARNDLYLWLGAVTLIVAIAGLAMALVYRRWRLVFCLSGLGLSYAVISNFLMLGAIMAERLMYLPSVFFVLILSIFLAKLPSRIGTTVVALLISAACFRTFTYVRHWNSRQGFYAYSVQEQPRSVKIRLLDGEYYLEEGHVDLNEALSQFETATQLAPDDPNSWDSMGLAEEKAEDWQKAIEYFKRAYALQPSMPRNNRIVHATQRMQKAQAVTKKS